MSRMTVRDTQTIRRVLTLLRAHPASFNRDAAFGTLTPAQRDEALKAYRQYVDSWIVPELVALLPDEPIAE